MLSLVLGDSQAGRCTARPPGAHLKRAAWALSLLGSVFGCGGDDGTQTVALADSGSLSILANNNLDIPTTVAVRASDNMAWVAESQFDHYTPFGGDGMPGGFRIIGVPLAGGAAQQIPLPANFFPEGITISKSGRLYIGSVADGSIYTVAPNALTADPFVAKNTLPKPSVLGMAVSGDNGILWVCNTVTSPPAGTLPSAAVVGIGAGDGLVKATHELPASSVGAFCNDIVIAENGTLWATESFGGRLFRIPAGELPSNTPATAWLQATELSGPMGPAVGAFGVNGLALISNKLFVVNSSQGTLLSIDPTLASPTSADLHPVALTESGVSGGVVLANPDGITRINDTDLLVVENGLGLTNGKRLTRVSLDTQ
jgi:hypothetical protein